MTRASTCLNCDELGMPRLGVGQGPVPERAVPGGDERPVAARIQKEPKRLDFQSGVEQDFQVVEQHDLGGSGSRRRP